MRGAPEDQKPPERETEEPQLGSLVDLIRRLRAPDGCPWDQEQTLDDLRAYLLEEAHEAADTIDRADWASLREELGDLLFQLCFVAVLADEQGHFTLRQVIAEIHSKMVDRHPHVFGDDVLGTAQEVANAWGRRKSQRSSVSALGGVPSSLPALTAAYRLGQKAAALGFDWDRADQVLDKVREEVEELEEAVDSGGRQHIEAEIGDLLLGATSLARHLGCDPEQALARANLRFRSRFAHLEGILGERLTDESTPLGERRAEMERLWNEAKALERA